MDENGYTCKSLATKADLSERTIRRMKCEDEYRPTKEMIIAVCVAMKLGFNESLHLLRMSSFRLQENSPIDAMYLLLLKYEGKFSVREWNRVLLDDYSIDPSNFGSNTPVAAWFKSIGGTAFGFILPILAGFIARSIADRPALVVGFVGGALAASGSTFANPGGGVPSAFLGALVAGFAAGFIVKGMQKVCDKLPASLEGIKPVLIYPLCGTLIIGVLMCLINPIVGALNSWISNVLMGMSSGSSVVLGLILGAMMATDMGGPLNKAAYVFGTAALANQNEIGYMIMAAVMVGGMVPPIAIAISTMVSKKKYTEAERKTGPANIVMGLSFITEGAIPFAAADPLHVIPSLMVGSGIAGALSMAFKCTLMAPHGGIFVFPVVGNVAMYLAALVVGSVVGALMLGLLKKNVEE